MSLLAYIWQTIMRKTHFGGYIFPVFHLWDCHT